MLDLSYKQRKPSGLHNDYHKTNERKTQAAGSPAPNTQGSNKDGYIHAQYANKLIAAQQQEAEHAPLRLVLP